MTYQTIESWARLTRRTVHPREVQAIMAIDGVMLFPGDSTASGSD